MIHNNVDLSIRAEEFENLVENHLVDSSGLLYSLIEFDTLKPFPHGFFTEAKGFLRWSGARHADFSDFLLYENVGMVTGAYLSAMVRKYEATKNPAALQVAYRCFAALKKLFDRCQAVEEGYYCKPYGGQISDQVSSDQYIYTFAALDLFMKYADAPHKAQALDILCKMAAWWISKKYCYPYFDFGNPLEWPLVRFPVFSWLGWHYTGNESFKSEFARLSELEDVKKNVPFGERWVDVVARAKQQTIAHAWDEINFSAIVRLEKKRNLRLIHVNPETTQSGFLSLEGLLEYGAPNRELWLIKARTLYDYGRKGIGADFLASGFVWLDPETETLSPVCADDLIELNCTVPLSAPCSMVCKSGMGAAMFCRAAVALDRYIPDLGSLDLALDILHRLTKNEMRWFIDEHRILTPAWEWTGRVFSGDAAAHWLWAYWEIKAKYGVIKPQGVTQ